MRRLFMLIFGILIITAVVVAGVGLRQRHVNQDRPQAGNAGHTDLIGTTGVEPATEKASDGDDRGETVTTTLFRNIARRQNPIVVAVTTQSHVKTTDLRQLFGQDDFFRRFFDGVPQPQEQLRRALGSGFLISPDGEIVTNNHVVAGAEQIRVALFSDEHKTYVADVVGRDPLTDSALIRLKDGPANLPIAQLGDSDALDPGDWVMAIGNPFELGHTVTVGVISYKGRPFATTEGRFQNMLQTDASINPGNSGGPLLDVHGQVVGINTAILGNESGGNVGIGFAVPINTVKTLLPHLRKGSVQRGQLGVQILTAPVTDETAKQLGLPKAEGAIISRVEAGSPADHAGLRAGDVIVSFNNTPVGDADRLTSLVVNTPPATPAPIVFYRGGQRRTVTATIEKLDLAQNDRADNQPGRASGFGLSLSDITPEAAQQLGLSTGTAGAVVQNVEPFTPAANAGIRSGDVILEINRQPVRTADQGVQAFRSLKAGDLAFVLLSRGGVQQFVELRKD